MFRKIAGFQQKHLVEWVHSKMECSTGLVPKKSEVIEKRNYLFAQEQKRQLEEVGRIEKMNVEIRGPPEDVLMVMNKDISTPYDCCKHISLGLCQNAALALIDEKTLWDMHRPLPGNCSVQFLTFNDKNPYNLNKAFWRTGSFLLGAVISKSFKNDITVHLHSFPPPFIKSGSFIYDVNLKNVDDWKVTADELRILSAEFLTFVQKNHKIERLKVTKSIAAEMFEDNPCKSAQIPSIAANAEDKLVTLYKVDDHIDISNGPMVGNTSFFGRCSVTNVFRIHVPNGYLYRFQAVALPKGIMLNNFAYQIIQRRGAHLNEADYPGVAEKDLVYYGGVAKEDRTSNKDVPQDIFALQ